MQSIDILAEDSKPKVLLHWLRLNTHKIGNEFAHLQVCVSVYTYAVYLCVEFKVLLLRKHGSSNDLISSFMFVF